MKLPWMKFFAGDWLRDPNLSKCRPATRGIWMDALCVMHSDEQRGVLSGTIDQLAMVLRASRPEIVKFLKDIFRTGSADVTCENGLVTLENRRMAKAYKARKHCSDRVRRHRRNARVTPLQRTGNAIEVRSQKSEVRGEGKSGAAAPSPSFLILREKELKRVETRLEKMREWRDQWDEADRAEVKRLKGRREELLKTLGMAV